MPDAAALHQAALAHLARYAATQADLTGMLDRRIARWARAASGTMEAEQIAAATKAARDAARGVVQRLVATGAVDDGAFAAARARRLARAGRSRRAVAAHLAAHGVAGEAVRAALPEDPEGDLAAALALARRRRLGPFGSAQADAEAQRRELAVLARAGFSQEVARRALAMDLEDAEVRLNRLRRA